MKKSRLHVLTMLSALGLLGCGADVSFFNPTFENLIAGGRIPIAPGPDVGYVMVLAMNATSDDSIEWVVTAESEEITVNLDGNGGVLSFQPARILEPQTVELLTDPSTPTLAMVFDNTPASFPPVGPGALTFEHIQDVIAQLAAKDPESVLDRDFIRLVRVLRIGLGPNLDVPANRDEGIIVRPAGSNPDIDAGNVFPSEVNNALSFDVGNDPADFANGDIVIFLATTSSRAIGGIRVAAGRIDGNEANGGSFSSDTFQILRDAEGPISPRPPN